MPVDYRRVLDEQRSAARNGSVNTRERLEEVEVSRG